MARNIRKLGLVLIAVFALGAVAAQAASAATEHTFNSEIGNTVLTADNSGLGEHVLSVTTKGGTKLSVSCTTVLFSGNQVTKTADEINLHPTFGKKNAKGEAGSCKLAGITVTVTTTGCNFTFDSDTSGTPENATTSIVCEAGKVITSTAAGCTISIGSQGPLHGVSYTGEGSGASRTIKVAASVKGIAWSAKGALCGLIGLGNGETGTNGEYTGTALTKGFEFIEGPFIPEGGTDKDAYKEGPQAGVFLTTP